MTTSNLTRRLAATLVAAASVAAFVPAHAEVAARPGAVADQNRRIVAGAFERWARGGRDFFQEVLSPDVVWTIQGSGPAAGVYRGRDDLIARAVKPFTDRLATPITPTVRQVWAEGEHVVVQWDGVATAGDGQPYRNSYVWIFRMAGGKAAEVTAYLDLVPYDDVFRRVSPKS